MHIILPENCNLIIIYKDEQVYEYESYLYMNSYIFMRFLKAH